MITPFGPPNDDLDRLNTILDVQATGKRAPVPDPASATDALAATARLVSRTPLDAREHASIDTLDSIWRNVMHAHAIPDSTAITGARPQAVRSSSRVEENRGRRATASSPWFSVAAMVVLLVGIVGGAWAMRGGTGGGGEPIRLAAVSPLGTPEGKSQWLTWIQPEECTAEPMTTEEYAAIMREQPDISGRSYEVVGPADPAPAEAVARAARAHEACLLYGDYRQTRSLETDAYVSFAAYSANRTISAAELHALNLEHGQLLSKSLPAGDASDRIVATSEKPPEGMPRYIPEAKRSIEYPVSMALFGSTYLPADAMVLADGRVAMPVTMMYWVGTPADPEAEEEIGQLIDEYTSIRMMVYVDIFSDESGSWKLDERLGLCQGDCDEYWATGGLQTPPVSPLATPEG